MLGRVWEDGVREVRCVKMYVREVGRVWEDAC